MEIIINMSQMLCDVRCLILGMSKRVSVTNILKETGLTLRRGHQDGLIYGYPCNVYSYGLLHSCQNILPSKLLNEIPVSFSTYIPVKL
jgi:hypothetical protein